MNEWNKVIETRRIQVKVENTQGQTVMHDNYIIFVQNDAANRVRALDIETGRVVRIKEIYHKINPKERHDHLDFKNFEMAAPARSYGKAWENSNVPLLEKRLI